MYESNEKMVTFISDDDLRNEDDILYRPLYRSRLKINSLLFGNEKEKEKRIKNFLILKKNQFHIL